MSQVLVQHTFKKYYPKDRSRLITINGTEPQKLTREQLKELYVACRDDFWVFCDHFMSHMMGCEPAGFHMELYRLLPTYQRLALATPRGHAKSTICSILYPLWAGLFGHKKFITLISASEGLAIGWLRVMKKELETNKLTITFFGDMKSDKWSENHIIFKNKIGTVVQARGAGGQVRGLRPDLLILDDLETNESVESEDQRKKLKEWIFKDCLNTLLPGGQFIMVGTIIHQLSVLNDVLQMDNGWVKKKYQAYFNGEQKEGNELWSAMWSHEKLQARKREIGSTAFSAEYMNNPLSDESAPIKDHHIKCWLELPKVYTAVIAVDPAYSEDENSDYKVAVLVLCDERGVRYLANYIRTHAPIGEFYSLIINMFLANRGAVLSVGIPNSGVEKGFFEGFVKECSSRGVSLPLVELKNVFNNADTGVSVRKKKNRIVAALQPLFENGRYLIGANHIEARDELLTIGSSRWDDLVDAMAYAEQIITPYSAGNIINNYSNNNYKREYASKAQDYGVDYD